MGSEQNIYKHPDRYHDNKREPSIPYSRLHDIYSFGVVLLEIRLGREAMELHRSIPMTFEPKSGSEE
jgi:serine/threonine protein kinase